MYDTPCNSVGTVTLSAESVLEIDILWLGEDDGLLEDIPLIDCTSSSAFVTSNIPLCPNFEPAIFKK